MQAPVAPSQRTAEVAGKLVRFLNKDASKQLFRVLGEHDLTFTQLKALVMLEDAGELAVKDLAAAMGLSLPAASRAVDGLVQRGHVERRESEQDRRSRLLALLPPGRDALRSVSEARLAALEAFLAGLPEADVERLHDALLPIVERIDRP